MKARAHSTLFAILLIGATMGTSLLGQADASIAPTWTVTNLAGLTDTVSKIHADGHSGKIGVAYQLKNSHRVGFALGDFNGWTVKTNDISGTAAGLQNPEVKKLGGTKWGLVVSGDTSGRVEYWLSSDDGATWAKQKAFVGGGGDGVTISGQISGSESNGVVDVAYEGNVVAAGSVVAIFFSRSTDYGVTWSSPDRIDDSDGSPAGQGTGTGDCTAASGKLGGIWADGNQIVVSIDCNWSGATPRGVVVIGSNNGGDFFTAPSSQTAGSYAGLIDDLHSCGANGAGDFQSLHGSSAGPILAYRKPTTTCGANTFHTGTWGLSATGSIPQGTAADVPSSTAVNNQPGTWAGSADNNPHGQGLLLTYATASAATPTNPTLYFQEGRSSAWISTYTLTTSDSGIGAVALTNDHAYFIHADQSQGGQILIAAAVVSSPATIALIDVDGLVGFDVDFTGSVVITRQSVTSTQSTIKVYAGATLASGGQATSTCVNRDGVAATRSGNGAAYVTYSDCNSTHTATNNLRIRSARLTDPEGETGCTGSSCGGNPTANVHVPNSMAQLATMQQAQWDYQNHAVGVNGDTLFTVLSWAFSTNDGRIGIYSVKITPTNGFPDRSSCANTNAGDACGSTAMADIDVSAFPQVDQICTSLSIPTQLAAVSQNAPLQTFTGDPGSTGTTEASGITPTISQLFTISGNYLGATAIGCGGGRFMASTASKVGVLSDDGHQLWSKNTTGSELIPSRGLTISGGGEWGAYTTGTRIYVVNATTGAPRCTIDAPPGTFQGMKMDFPGNSLYFATATKLGLYDITSCTNIIPKNTNPLPNLCPAPPCDDNGNSIPSTGGIFGNPSGYDLSGSGDATKGGMTLTVLFVIGMAGVGSTMIAGTKGRIWGATIGGILGFGMVVVYGDVPGTVVFLIVALAAVLIGFRARSQSSGSD